MSWYCKALVMVLMAMSRLSADDGVMMQALYYEKAQEYSKAAGYFEKLYAEDKAFNTLIHLAFCRQQSNATYSHLLQRIDQSSKTLPVSNFYPGALITLARSAYAEGKIAKAMHDRLMVKGFVALLKGARALNDISAIVRFIGMFGLSELVCAAWLEQKNEQLIERRSLIISLKLAKGFPQYHSRLLTLAKRYMLNSDEDSVVFALVKPLIIANKEPKVGFDFLSAMYLKTHNERYLNLLAPSAIDDKKAIDFLQKNAPWSPELAAVYSTLNRTSEAIEILHHLQNQTQNATYYLQEAQLLWGSKQMPDLQLGKRIIGLYEKAYSIDRANMALANNLAYYLIYYEIDLKRGIRLSTKALTSVAKQRGTFLSHNAKVVAYKDTLMYGLMKDHQCQKAKKLMYEIEATPYRDEPEFIEHKKAIKSCK